eukprot:1469825-Rhodomonas_salina.5
MTHRAARIQPHQGREKGAQGSRLGRTSQGFHHPALRNPPQQTARPRSLFGRCDSLRFAVREDSATSLFCACAWQPSLTVADSETEQEAAGDGLAGQESAAAGLPRGLALLPCLVRCLGLDQLQVPAHQGVCRPFPLREQQQSAPEQLLFFVPGINADANARVQSFARASVLLSMIFTLGSPRLSL